MGVGVGLGVGVGVGVPPPDDPDPPQPLVSAKASPSAVAAKTLCAAIMRSPRPIRLLELPIEVNLLHKGSAVLASKDRGWPLFRPYRPSCSKSAGVLMLLGGLSSVTARAPSCSMKCRIEWRSSLANMASSRASAVTGHRPMIG